jgi:hypothetical protein
VNNSLLLLIIVVVFIVAFAIGDVHCSSPPLQKMHGEFLSGNKSSEYGTTNRTMAFLGNDNLNKFPMVAATKFCKIFHFAVGNGKRRMQKPEYDPMVDPQIILKVKYN